VTLSRASDVQVGVEYRVDPFSWSATQGVDFAAESGTVVFAPGQTQAAIPVTVFGDTTYEAGEYFQIQLTGATNAVVVLDGAEPGRGSYTYFGIPNDDVL
jgi:hypothetical protein